MIRTLSRIRNDWLRVPLLIFAIPVHFVGRVFDALFGCPQLLLDEQFYNNSARIYGAMISGAFAE